MTRSALDHDCAWGCAKITLDPKLHAFDECFSGNIRMGDIDGAVERNGHVLFLEWKKDRPSDEKARAQAMLHQALTRNSRRHVSVWVVGDPETMRAYEIRVMRNGQWVGDWEATTLDDLRARFRAWFDRVNAVARAAE